MVAGRNWRGSKKTHSQNQRRVKRVRRKREGGREEGEEPHPEPERREGRGG